MQGLGKTHRPLVADAVVPFYVLPVNRTKVQVLQCRVDFQRDRQVIRPGLLDSVPAYTMELYGDKRTEIQVFEGEVGLEHFREGFRGPVVESVLSYGVVIVSGDEYSD